MKINKFSFKNFRNLSDGEIIPSDKTNIIYGNNAQGKTNLIEAMWLFTGGKSFRGAKDIDLIQFDRQNTVKLDMSFYSEEREQRALIEIQKEKMTKRKLVLNEVNKKSISQIIGKFCAVVFSPIHLNLVKEGPNVRRKFVDAAICQIKPSYIFTISEFNRTLNQRNTLLKDIKYKADLLDTLDVWDEKIVRLGSTIIKNRIEYCEKLKKYSNEIYRGISEEKEEMDLKYITSVKTNDIYSELKERMQKSIKDDINLGYTTIGPHRDDIEILINSVNAKSFASQGQQRSAVLSLKLSEAKILKETIGESPIIFLDDVMSELDISRQSFLSNNINEFQTFITCCDPSILKFKDDVKFFHMKAGKIVLENNI